MDGARLARIAARLVAAEGPQVDMTYTIEFEEVPVSEGSEDSTGSVTIVRQDGKKIRGTYSVEGGVGSLRGGGDWDSLENSTELDREMASKALMVAHDKNFEEGEGPHSWAELLDEAAKHPGF